MVHYRHLNDPAEAIKTFKQGALLAAYWLRRVVPRLVEERPDERGSFFGGGASSQHFQMPMFCCLLAGDWETAGELAKLGLDFQCRDEGDPYTASCRVMYGVILNAPTLPWPPRTHPKWFKTMIWETYTQAALCIHARDQTGFSKQLELIDEAFSKGAKQRDETKRIENAIYFDFTAVCLCKIAARQGIVVEHDSIAIPAAMVDYWQTH